MAALEPHRHAAVRRRPATRREGSRHQRHQYRRAGHGRGADTRPPDAAGAARAQRRRQCQVKIVWDGIDRRITQLTRMPGSVTYVVPSPDSRTYLFSAMGGGDRRCRRSRRRTRHVHHRRRWHAPDPPEHHGDRRRRRRSRTRRSRRLRRRQRAPMGARQPQHLLHAGRRPLHAGRRRRPRSRHRRGGSHRRTRWTRRSRRRAPQPRRPSTDTASAGAAPRRIPFSVRMEIDIAAERKQVFEEAWRVMKNRFYDPKMHGANWAAAKDKYESLLPHIADTEELHNVIMEMIGDMNASHTGISGGSSPAHPGPARGAHRHPLSRLRPGARCHRLLQGRPHLPQRPGRSRLRQARPRQLHPLGQRQGSEDQRELLEALQHPAGPQVRIPGELQALDRRRLDRRSRAAHRRRA